MWLWARSCERQQSTSARGNGDHGVWKRRETRERASYQGVPSLSTRYVRLSWQKNLLDRGVDEINATAAPTDAVQDRSVRLSWRDAISRSDGRDAGAEKSRPFLTVNTADDSGVTACHAGPEGASREGPANLRRSLACRLRSEIRMPSRLMTLALLFFDR